MPSSNRADYFDIHDEDGQPLAGLLVLLDGSSPARAELHVARDTERSAAQTAVQQARRLLTERYTRPARPAVASSAALPDDGDEEVPASDPLPLYVLRVDQQNVVDVALPPSPTRPTPLTGAATYSRSQSGAVDESAPREFHLPSADSLLPYITAAVVGLALVLIVWAASVFLNRSSPDDTMRPGVAELGESADTAPAEIARPAASITDTMGAAEGGVGETGTETASDNAAAASTEGAPVVDPAVGAQTNGLPPSKNADASLQIGDRARMGAGLQAYLLPEPSEAAVENAEANNLGVLTDEQVVTLVGGPIWQPGESDTIIWWLVELADGEQAWVVANTSQFTLLRPAE